MTIDVKMARLVILEKTNVCLSNVQVRCLENSTFYDLLFLDFRQTLINFLGTPNNNVSVTGVFREPLSSLHRLKTSGKLLTNKFLNLYPKVTSNEEHE